jgi:hypothetical protein
VYVCERERECVCVRERECVCERESVCMCVRERESVCVCERKRERQREREHTGLTTSSLCCLENCADLGGLLQGYIHPLRV